jgi:hypothetical protein
MPIASIINAYLHFPLQLITKVVEGGKDHDVKVLYNSTAFNSPMDLEEVRDQPSVIIKSFSLM